jgi:transcriptional regulator with XRE-family HTH domain
MPLSFGAELRARRLTAGISLTRLAHSINYSKSHLSKIENGTKEPGILLARLCDVALDADGELSSIVTAAQPLPTHRSPDKGNAADPWIMQLDPGGSGRFTLDGHRPANAEPAHRTTWPPTPNAAQQHYTDDVVGEFRVQFDSLRRLTQSLPPAAMMPLLIAGTHATRLAAATAPAGIRARLFLLAGRYAELTGWMTQEAGDDDGAAWWTDLAVEYAAAGGDRHLAAFAGVRHADIAMYQRNGPQTVELAQHVQRLDCGSRIRGLAAQREAQGHAIDGDRDACNRALDRAAMWLGQSDDTSTEPVLGSSTVNDPIDMATGWCLHDLGRPDRAADRLVSLLERTPAWASRTRGRLGARYALALLAAGDIDRGCAALEQALDDCAGLGSATIRTDLREAGRHLNRHPTSAAARTVMPRLTDALGH